MKKNKIDKSYKQVVKLGELQYITKQNIDEASINITSPEMYKEVDQLNSHFMYMQKKKELMQVNFWTMFLFNFGMMLFELYAILALPKSAINAVSLMFAYVSHSITILFLIVLLCFVALLYFGFLRKSFSWILVSVISVVLIFVSIINVVIPVLTIPSFIIMKKFKKDVEEDVGGPSFVRLNTAYIRDTSNDETEFAEMESSDMFEYEHSEFEKYAAKDELVDLCDNDLFSGM